MIFLIGENYHNFLIGFRGMGQLFFLNLRLFYILFQGLAASFPVSFTDKQKLYFHEILCLWACGIRLDLRCRAACFRGCPVRYGHCQQPLCRYPGHPDQSRRRGGSQISI
jgi:hypothetical protein